MQKRQDPIYTVPFNCVCCKKCWLNPVTMRCPYGGPFYGTIAISGAPDRQPLAPPLPEEKP